MAVIAYGTAARIAKGAINRLREEDENVRIGLIRPITLWPFPTKVLRDAAKKMNDFFVFEMSTGQMVEDVRLALEGKGKIHFYGRPGGVVPTPVELVPQHGPALLSVQKRTARNEKSIRAATSSLQERAHALLPGLRPQHYSPADCRSCLMK